jgi:hypothetical protein
MLYKHDRLEKKLREHGRAGRATILSIRTEGRGNSARASWSDDDDLTTSWVLCRLELQVMPPGEAPFEVTLRTRLNTLKTKGDTVPVLYDPDDHEKVVVDYELDARVQMEGVEAARAALPHPGEAALAAAGGDADLAMLLELEKAEGGGRGS